MSPFGEHAVNFIFTSNRFDHASELPEDYNAGNRFYGRDVAELVNDGLVQRGLDSRFFDEDWGWQVLATRADGRILEVSVYHDPEETDADEWMLMVRLLEKRRLLPRREIPVDDAAVRALEQTLGDAGIVLERS